MQIFLPDPLWLLFLAAVPLLYKKFFKKSSAAAPPPPLDIQKIFWYNFCRLGKQKETTM
nr:MAG TPA: hypothetical protein [Caudoviricetes sp.]